MIIVKLKKYCEILLFFIVTFLNNPENLHIFWLWIYGMSQQEYGETDTLVMYLRDQICEHFKKPKGCFNKK